MLNQHRQWVFPIIGCLLLGLAALYSSDGLWAAPTEAPNNQTVPFPTFTPINTPVPTATPTATEEGSGDDSGDDATPTPTPTDLADGAIEDEDDLEDDEPAEEEPSEDDSGGDSSGGDSSGGDSSGGDSSGGDAGGGDGANEPELPSAKVSPIVLNVRSGPGTENAVVGTIFQDDSVTILGRVGDWWQVCCALGSSDPGWVDSQFLVPEFDLSEVDTLLPELADEAPAASESSSERTTNAGVSNSAVNTSQLEFLLSHDPLFVWQGQEIEMTFTVTNSATTAAENVLIRNDFPAALSVVEVEKEGDVEIEFATSPSDTTVLEISWERVEGGESVSVTALLEIAEDLEPGSVIDNLAVASASNADDVTTGISIGMPPSRLPNFR